MLRLISNILWALLGGIWLFLIWGILGILLCLTVIGIPFGKQCFKLASISLDPFGKEIEYGGGAASFLVNILWFLLSGLELAATNFLLGCVLCISIIGIPFGKQYFKIAKLSLAPFGARIVSKS